MSQKLTNDCALPDTTFFQSVNGGGNKWNIFDFQVKLLLVLPQKHDILLIKDIFLLPYLFPRSEGASWMKRWNVVSCPLTENLHKHTSRMGL